MMDAAFTGRWVDAADNLLVITLRAPGRYRARFVRRDGKVSLVRRWLARLSLPAFGLYGVIRDGYLELEIGRSRALLLRFARDQEGERLLPLIVPGIWDDDLCSPLREPWIEPLSPFRREAPVQPADDAGPTQPTHADGR